MIGSPLPTFDRSLISSPAIISQGRFAPDAAGGTAAIASGSVDTAGTRAGADTGVAVVVAQPVTARVSAEARATATDIERVLHRPDRFQHPRLQDVIAPPGIEIVVDSPVASEHPSDYNPREQAKDVLRSVRNEYAG